MIHLTDYVVYISYITVQYYPIRAYGFPCSPACAGNIVILFLFSETVILCENYYTLGTSGTIDISEIFDG